MQDFELIMLRVADIDRSAAFYRGLEMEPLEDEPNWKTFRLGPSTLALRKWDPGTEDERPIKYGISMAFTVPDVDASLAELENKGAHVLVVPKDEEFGRYAKIVDPDGYIIMILSRRD